VKYAFMAAHQQDYAVKIQCRVLEVARSGYYAWLKRPESERDKANQVLSAAIQASHERSRGTYGSPRIHADLKRRGLSCSRKRVEGLMHRAGLQARRRRCYKHPTNSQHDYLVAPNLLDRQFSAKHPNEKWLTDITYMPTLAGWLYLAVVLDVYSRQIVGWAMDKTMEQSLVAAALDMALVHR